jgi:LPS sulfotransferase NodH
MVRPAGWPTPFVVFFEGRSGSTYLIESLHEQPGVYAEKEFFAELRSKNKGPQDQLDWARGYFTPLEGDRYRAIGFKAKLQDILSPTGLADLLIEFDARVVLLRRRNRVKLVVSLLNAMRLNDATGEWNLYDAGERPAAFRVDLDTFRDWLRKIEAANRRLVDYVEGTKLPLLSIDYEDLLVDERSTMSAVCEFLGVAYDPSRRGTCIKNTDDDLSRVVLNLDEVRSEFSGSRYEPMFDEVLVRSHDDP